MPLKDYFHILNPNRDRRRGVERFFAKHAELSCMWVERTSHPTHLETLIQWAFNEKRHKIAVWGGDGTYSRVVQAIYEQDAFPKMEMALVPAGTCNDLARKLVLPGWKKVARAGLTGRGLVQNLDVGLLTAGPLKRTFINNAGFGRTVERIGARSNPIKDIFSFRPKRLDLDWESGGARHFETRDALLAVVCNAPYFNGAMHFDRAVEPTDGKLNAFFEAPQGRLQLLWKFMLSKIGRRLSNCRTFRIDAERLRVESSADLFPQVDGEPAGMAGTRSLEFSVMPKKLKVVLWR